MAKAGRPKTDTEAVTVRLDQKMLGTLDAFRKDESDLPTRPESIRRLLVEALQTKGYLPK